MLQTRQRLSNMLYFLLKHFCICNCLLLQFGIECRENFPGAQWCKIPPGCCVPFWPMSSSSNKQVVACLSGTFLESQPFNITETHATFLQIYHEVCLFVCRDLCVKCCILFADNLCHGPPHLHVDIVLRKCSTTVSTQLQFALCEAFMHHGLCLLSV